MENIYSLIRDGQKSSQFILQKIEEGDWEELSIFNPLQRDENEWNILHWTVQNYDAMVFSYLYAMGAGNFLDAQTREGFSALFLATILNKIEIVQFLVNKNAKVNLQDAHGQTALHKACESENFNIVSLLLFETNVDVNIQDLMGRTPLHWAAAKGNTKIMDLLIAHKCLLLITKTGESPLHWACKSGYQDCVLILLKSFPNIDTNLKNERGETAFDISLNAETQELLTGYSRNSESSKFAGTANFSVSIQPKKAVKKIIVNFKTNK